MIFKCYLCSSYHFWNKKKCYEIHVTSNDGADRLFKKKVCEACGDGIGQVYDANKDICDMSDKLVESINEQERREESILLHGSDQ